MTYHLQLIIAKSTERQTDIETEPYSFSIVDVDVSPNKNAM